MLLSNPEKAYLHSNLENQYSQKRTILKTPFKERVDEVINTLSFFAHCLEVWSEEPQTEKDK